MLPAYTINDAARRLRTPLSERRTAAPAGRVKVGCGPCRDGKRLAASANESRRIVVRKCSELPFAAECIYGGPADRSGLWY